MSNEPPSPAAGRPSMRLPDRLAGARRTLQTWLGVFGIATCALAAWMLAPRAARAPEPGPLVCLVDVSESVTRRRPDWVPWMRGELAAAAAAARAERRSIAVWFFARGSERIFGPGPPAELDDLLAGRSGSPLAPVAARGRGGGSELGRALARAESALPGLFGVEGGGAPGRVLLWTDARVTGDTGRLAAWRAAGVAVERRALPPARSVDVAVRALHVPERIELGAPLAVRVELWTVAGRPSIGRLDAAGAARPEASLELTLRPERGPARTLRRSIDLSGAIVAAGAIDTAGAIDPTASGVGRAEEFELGPAPPGRSQVHARVRVAGDPVPENDRATAWVRTDETLLCGLVGPPELERWLAPAGRASPAGLAWTRVAPGDLATALESLDVVVLWDPLPPGSARLRSAPAGSPGPLPAELLAEWVGRGGGLLVVSGWNRLGRGAPALEALLPLAPAEPDSGPRDVVLLVDGSGSMAGAPFDEVRAAALALADTVPASDRLSLRFFTGGLRPELVLREAGDRAGDAALRGDLRALLEARVPRGPTWILDSLAAFAGERERTQRRALVLLLTDGRERGGGADPTERAPALRRRLAAAGVELVVIAVGEHPDLEFLRMLSGPDVEPRVALEIGSGSEATGDTGSGSLAELFRQEVNRESVIAGPLATGVPLPAPPLASITGWTEGRLPGFDLPGFERALRATARAGAEVLLAAETGEPLLAVWEAVGPRTGSPARGRAAEFAALPGAAWAPGWAAPELWTPLVRWLGRAPRRAGPAARAVSWAGERWLLIDGLDAAWPAGLAWTARRMGSGGGSGGRADAPAAAGWADPPPRGPWGAGARLGPLDAALAAGAGGPPLELVLAGPDGPRVLPWASGTPREAQSWLPPRQIPSGPALGTWQPQDGPRTGRGDPGRRAPLVLALGLLALAGAALAPRIKGSGPDAR